MRQRRETVEYPFGTMKARMGATHFLTKTLPKVAAEMALSVLAYNLTRVMNIRRDQAADRCDRGLRPNRSWLLTEGGCFYTAKTHTGSRPLGNGMSFSDVVIKNPVATAGMAHQESE